ncbi:hypothetical protein SAMN05421505_11168 [Sinosporangium album]|uniref:ABC-2 family transporter protein n=1 Tax=Sinosporangium album TaxID=504805 RepID=A0A1G7ZK59_9ACTN|nr:ABC transporter permease [Sinosporangium album]SDH08490.1 hypothetical protein SAMN05421505_11168 [Sinosporangium album]
MNVIRSEWTKLRSVRSTWIAVLSTISSAVALSVLGSSDLSDVSPTNLPADWDPTAASLDGFLFAQLVIGMLGALSITPEFHNGMIGTSLATVPARSRLLAAKAIVVTAIALVTSLVTTLLTFTGGQIMVSRAGLPAAGIGDPGVAGALIGATLYLTFIALIGAGIGTVTRSTASSLAVLVGALLLVPALGPSLPGFVGEWFARYWPITAGQAAYKVVPMSDMVTPVLGIVILALAAAATTVAGHAAFRVRDV